MPDSILRFRRRSLANITRTWREIKGTARRTFTGRLNPDLPKEDMEYLGKKMLECLEGKGGEASARDRTEELGQIYLKLSPAGKERFLGKLAKDYPIDRDRLKELSKAYLRARDEKDTEPIERSLRETLNSPRTKILRQFNTLPDGFKFLVDMRADLLRMSKKDKSLKGLERDLKQLLNNWFDVGLLDLEEITWESPASLLEKLIDYEAVHRITSWNDLKNRLTLDRRCFAFFHGKMPYEPLIFIEVALTRGLAGNIKQLLDKGVLPENLKKADTAIFYSINSTQKGLAGISLGNFLIKRVVSKISNELSNIKRYSTLSPVPGFGNWLTHLLKGGDSSMLSAEDILSIRQLESGDDAAVILLKALDSNRHGLPATASSLRPILLRLMKHYLLKEKKGIHAVDPVENFHLSNGARIERINWLADTSEKGMRQSAGMMVNYLYSLSDIDENHEAYITEGKISISNEVKQLPG